MRTSCKKLFLWGFLGAVAIFAAGAVFLFQRLPDYRLALEQQRSRAGTAVVDRSGRVLRLFPDGRDRFSIWCPIERIPPHLKNAVIAAEDKRFYSHPGFDPIAVLRATYSNFLRRKTVSGASTITQQVVRLIHPRPRTYRSKLVEFLAAIKMERQLSKDLILELHMNLSPMSGNIRGVGLAARSFFGKEIENITVAETAVLAALPRSPSRFDPRRSDGREKLNKEKDRILRRMTELGHISQETNDLMSGQAVRFRMLPVPLEAPHLLDMVLRRDVPRRQTLRTTIDLDIQHGVEQILHSHANRLRSAGIEQAGVIVSSVKESEILALVGSLGYSPWYQGYNNAVLARRSAGSILKPFLYALALEKGYGSSSEIPDTFRTYSTPQGDYQPYNADRKWYGPVNVRLALGNSLNMPAVKTLKEVGVDNFFNLLERLGIADESYARADRFGLGLAIGNIEVNLFRLVQAYGSLARRGLYKPLHMLVDEKDKGERIFSPEVAYVITHILADPSARLLTFGNPSYFDFGFPVSLKTGTSTNYRDSWMVAYTSRHVVGLWAGNFGGGHGRNVAAASALGPIMEQIIHLLYGAGPPELHSMPSGVREDYLCWMSGKTASPKCPYTVKELVLDRSGDSGMCELPHDRDFHYYLPATYAHWLHRKQNLQGRNRFDLATSSQGPESSPSGEATSLVKAKRIEIVSPHHLDRFILSPYNAGRVLFRAVPNPVVNRVVWMIDGMEVANTPPPYEFFWDLTRGRHVVHAITPNREAAEIVIHVE